MTQQIHWPYQPKQSPSNVQDHKITNTIHFCVTRYHHSATVGPFRSRFWSANDVFESSLSYFPQMAQQLETKNNRVADYEHKVEQLSQDLTTKEAYLVQTKQVNYIPLLIQFLSITSFLFFLFILFPLLCGVDVR